MSNPLFNALGGGIPQGNGPMQMIQQFMQFKQNFTCALQNTMNNNTRDIIDSQNAGTRAILDYLCNEKISSLQAENNDLRRAASQDRQSALLTTAMASQTQQLINAINPAPIPAYQVPNPNTYYGCGCNTGCNC
jgi:hypothetical protein